MSRYAQNTEVSTDRSRAEIERILARYGAEERILAKLSVEDRGHTTPCWIWQGALHNMGYGRVHIAGFQWYVHRISYSLFKAEIPLDYTIDHLCRVRACFNPDHLEPVTRGENVLRGQSPLITANRRKTCVRGHAMDEANTYQSPKGQRHCRACRRQRGRKQAWKQRQNVPVR